MKPLHICFVSQEYPPETGWGGIGAYMYEMAHGLAEAGHRVTVISRAAGEPWVCDTGGVTVHRVAPAPNFNGRKILWRLNGYWPGFAWAAMKKLRELHAIDSMDLVEAAECRADAFFIAYLRRRPRVVVRLHTAWIFVDRLNRVQPDRKKRLVYWLEKRAILRADAITAPSQAVVDLTRTWTPIAGRNVSVVPNPVNTSIFSCGAARRKPEVLFVGRLERRKLANLPEAMAQVLRRCPDAEFRFAGKDSPDETGRSWRERIVAQIPADAVHRLHFEHVPRERLPEIYREASVCVLPSIWENFPYALLEAMACGTPVIGTRTGGLPELIEDSVSGILVPPNDAAALADAMCRLLESPSQWEEMSRNARRRADELFSVGPVVARMVALYQSVLKTPRQPVPDPLRRTAY